MRYLVVLYKKDEAQAQVLATGKSAVLNGTRIENTTAGLHLNGQRVGAGASLRLSDSESLSVFNSCEPLPQPVSLAGQSVVSIGRSSKNDICLTGEQVSGSHALLRKGSSGWSIVDRGSRNGIYINGNRVQYSILREGDTIFLGGYLLRWHNGVMGFESICAGVTIDPKLQQPISAKPEQTAPKAAEYPWFQRSPRLRPETGALEVEILSPPQAGSKPEVSWLSVLLPPILMVSVMVVVVVVMSNGGGSGGLMSLAFTAPMSLISIVVGIVNYRSQTKKWERNRGLADEKYDAHLVEQEAKIQKAELSYIEALTTIHPSVSNCIRIAEKRDRRLWERGPADDDFLSVRIGTGEVPSNVTVKTPQAQLALEENPLLQRAQQMKERHRGLRDVPITVDLRGALAVGLAGKASDTRTAAYSLLCGIAAHHSYEDVKIACVFSGAEQKQWGWLRWLPHCWDNGRTQRWLADTAEDAKALMLRMEEILQRRRREKNAGEPHYVVLLADPALAERSGVTLLPEDPALGTTVIYACGDMKQLPGACRVIIENNTVRQNSVRKQYTPESVSAEQMDVYARSLAPIRFKSPAGAAKLPAIMPFLQGLNIGKVENLNVLGRWKNSRPFESLAVPIGLRENGEVFQFDIHERGHGPHGIVAGTAGWGKSELLSTWLLSLALHFRPEEVSFVLIDFKGDGLSGVLTGLPHVAGTISNIHDLSSIERNLAALQGELKRRELLFAQTGMENIHKYQMARRSGRDMEALPYLIVVIDEFAELKTQHPEQMDKFIQIARKGRSAGVLMALATQSPGGGIVTGQVSANSRFRICLKTAEAGESKDILGNADAFDINVRGRAIIKVGSNEVYEQVQTFYSKAPYHPEGKSGVKIGIVTLDGAHVRPEAYEKTVGAQDFVFSEARAIADYISGTARRAGIPGARQVWPDILPETLELSNVLAGYAAPQDGFAVPVGLVDDPEGQKQYPFVLDFARQGHHLLYGAPGTGKTNFLRAALMACARLYGPALAQFAILDFGTWGLKLFEKLPQCRCYSSEQDGISQAEDFLRYELERRRRGFAEQGASRLEDYREITGEAIPYLLVTIDNLAALHNAHPDFLDTLLAAARDGMALGIVLLMTTGSGGAFLYRMQSFIQNTHTLRLTDKSEYRQYVGGDGRHEPGNFPGRGFTSGPLEFQTALFIDGATEAERIKNLRAFCGAQQQPVQEQQPLASTDEYTQFGYDRSSGEPVAFHYKEMSGCVFVNSDLLGTIMKNLPGRVVCDDFDTATEEIAREYESRDESGAAEPPIFICVEDYAKFYEDVTNETVDRLDLLVRYGENRGIYVYIAGQADTLARFAQLGEKLFASCLLSGNALARGTALAQGSADFMNAPALGPGEACLLHDGKSTRVRLEGSDRA